MVITKGTPEDLLAGTVAVDVGRVDEVAPRLEGRADDRRLASSSRVHGCVPWFGTPKLMAPRQSNLDQDDFAGGGTYPPDPGVSTRS